MALPATDAFTATSGTNLTTYSSNWTVTNGAWDINSNAVTPNQSGNCAAYWNADTFGNNQYAKGTLKSQASGIETGPAVRMSSGPNCYVYRWKGNGTRKILAKIVDGTFTSFGSGGTITTDTVVELQVSGTTLTPLLNGSLDTEIGEITDSTFSTGPAGIWGTGDSASSRLDDWEAGNLANDVELVLTAVEAGVADQTIAVTVETEALPSAVSVGLDALEPTVDVSSPDVELVLTAVEAGVASYDAVVSSDAAVSPATKSISVLAGSIAVDAGLKRLGGRSSRRVVYYDREEDKEEKRRRLFYFLNQAVNG